MMRVLSFDPGAERCGWAVLATGPQYIASGIMAFPRNKMGFQAYRLLLELHTQRYVDDLLDTYTPDLIVNEVIPAVGGGNFVAATQSYLANCVVTTIHDCAFRQGIPVEQISARTVHKIIALNPRKAKKITKVMVRNGVIDLLPELKPRLSDWVKVFDEPDAIANGLTSLLSHT